MTPLAPRDSLSHLFTSSPSKPIMIFIPGAFHTATHFGPLFRYLEMQGYKSLSIRLPSMGEKTGNSTTGMAEDVATIRGVLEELVWDEEGGDGKENESRPRPPSSQHTLQRSPGRNSVVLIMHSTGAIPGIQAITALSQTHRRRMGRRGGIISIFFINGLLVAEGESLESTMRGMGEDVLPGFAEVEGPMVRPRNAKTTFYSDLPSGQAAYWSSKLEPQCASVYTTIVQKISWDLDIPVTYVRSTKDVEGLRVMDAMVAKMKKANWTIKTMESGNCPFLSCVEELGEMILKAGKIGQQWTTHGSGEREEKFVG